MEEEKEQRQREQVFRDYVGYCLRDIDTAMRIFLGDKTDVPSYLEIAHPEEAKKGKMTAEQIKNHVLDLLQKAG